MDLNQAQNEVFRYFLEFGSNVFFEIEYNDSLRQCLISNRGKNQHLVEVKSMKKLFGGFKFLKNWSKSGPKLGFSLFSQVWFISFLSHCIG